MKYFSALLLSILIMPLAAMADPSYVPAPPQGEVVAFDIPPGFSGPIVFYLATHSSTAMNVHVGVAGPAGVEAEVSAGSLRGGIEAAQANLTPAPVLSVSTDSQGVLQIAEGTVLLPIDSCRPRSRWVMQLTLSLERVPAEVKAAGFRVLAMLKEQRYRGPRAASIKPRADGRFAPQPLLLMSSVSAALGGKEGILSYRHRGALTPQPRVVRIEDYVSFKGLSLTRSPIDVLMRQGGKRTFVLVGEKGSYSVCFSMQRTRQVRNGYPL